MGLEKRRAWSHEEDVLLAKHIQTHGEGKWSQVSRLTGLKRSAKSCRFRWTNYLHPDLNFSLFSSDEEDVIIRMHKLVGNRWALIAGRLPGRTALAVKNYWNTKLNNKILDHHRHVVKPHCTHAARFSLSHHTGKEEGLSSDSFLKNEGQSDNSHEGSHILPGIGEAETKSTVNAEMKSRLLPADIEALDQMFMILPDPGSLHAIINNVILQEEENFGKQYCFLSDDEVSCMADIKEDEIDHSLWDVRADEPFSLWQSPLFHV